MSKKGPPEGQGIGRAEFQKALKSNDPARRAAAISRARYELDVEEAVIEALADPDAGVRAASVRALARWGARSGIRALVAASANDPSPDVRAEAVLALSRILEEWPKTR
jgi:HEAT repeat protein